jgi:hypothetical protein
MPLPKGRSGSPATQWRKGQSGNSGGRPKELGDLRALCREFGPEGVRIAESIARDPSTPPNARINAIQMILDRGYGKPVQTLAGDGDNPLFPNAESEEERAKRQLAEFDAAFDRQPHVPEFNRISRKNGVADA